VHNVEDPSIAELGPFDLVVCPGLLYHLENPFRAVRNLAALTRHCLWIETVVAADERPIALLVQEGAAQDQGLCYVAFNPSPACVIKMLYTAGFAHVYRETRLPDHNDFRSSFRQHPKRMIFVASHVELKMDTLVPQAEPRFGKRDFTWVRWPRLSRLNRKGRRALRRLSGSGGAINSGDRHWREIEEK
jgi:hypothetical protein